jgi:cell division protein FtsB
MSTDHKDLIERLRGGDWYLNSLLAVRLEAADAIAAQAAEIAQLRAELDALHTEIGNYKRILALVAERECK